jgi:predicted metalloprotease
MPILRLVNSLLMVLGIFTLGSFIFAENYFAKEVDNLKTATSIGQISYYEKNDIFKATAKPPTEADATQAEIETMMNKLAAGRDLLDSFWRENLAGQKISYISPRTVAFTGRINTLCGVIGSGNAAYCERSNTIYFDVNFFVRMMKMTAQNLNSDGDMAVIAILAHEWGHAVQAQIEIGSRVPMVNELQADCLSGAFARYATQKGVLEEGDIKEAAFAFAVGGDNIPWYAVQAHGDSRMRVGSFSLGFQKGIDGCH